KEKKHASGKTSLDQKRILFEFDLAPALFLYTGIRGKEKKTGRSYQLSQTVRELKKWAERRQLRQILQQKHQRGSERCYYTRYRSSATPDDRGCGPIICDNATNHSHTESRQCIAGTRHGSIQWWMYLHYHIIDNFSAVHSSV